MPIFSIQVKKTPACVKVSNTDPCAHFNDLQEVRFTALFSPCAASSTSRYSNSRVKTDVSTLHNVCEVLAEEASY